MKSSNSIRDPGEAKTTVLNTTAYRIYKILEWLNQKPLSLEELNQRFIDDPMVRKPLSDDTVWLYINTLKVLGCDIKRPVRSNDYRYALAHHSFGIFLDEKNIQTLTDIKTLAEEHFSYSEILSLDNFFKTILNHVTFSEEALEDKTHIQELFAKSRSIDYGSNMSVIETLKNYAKEQQLLMIGYDSPIKGKEKFYFLPEELKYQQGVLYLCGSQPKREESSLLRIERIFSYTPVQNNEIRDSLLASQQQTKTLVVKFFGLTPDMFEPLDMGEEIQYFGSKNPKYLQVTVQTRDLFVMKQKILEYGAPFQIVEPVAFRVDMVQTLKNMAALYKDSPR